MAKLTPVVLNKPDKFGNWNAQIRVGHKSKSVFIGTTIEVSKKYVDKKLNIKPEFVVDNLSDILKRYKEFLKRMDIENMTAAEVKAKILDMDKPKPVHDSINFLDFCDKYIDDLKKKGKGTTAAPLRTVLYSLKDYIKGDFLDVNTITSKFLKQYESYLRSPRILNRNNQGKQKEYHKPGLKDRGIHNHMRDLRTLFNEAKEVYNDEEIGLFRIPNNPFKKYKVVNPPETGDRSLDITQVKHLMGIPVIAEGEDLELRRKAKIDGIKHYKPNYLISGSRGELARDLGLLSLCLCGINAADLYELEASNSERIDYKRKKTRDRRKDDAFISIKIPDIAMGLYDKYAGKLQKRYAKIEYLNSAITRGMVVLREVSGIEGLQFIKFRHTFASWARNICRFSKDDVGMAMNHKDNSNKVTDIYIAKDWSIIDDVQSKTIALLGLDDELSLL